MSTFSEIINSGKPVLVDFFAEWCGPCKTMAPVMHQLAAKYGDKVKILKVDIDKNQPAAAKFNVSAVPTFIIFQNGQVKWRKSGAIPEGQLTQMLDSFL